MGGYDAGSSPDGWDLASLLLEDRNAELAAHIYIGRHRNSHMPHQSACYERPVYGDPLGKRHIRQLNL